MGPLPYPHRVTFLASTLHVPDELEHARIPAARLLSVLVFDHLLRHRMVTLGDHDDERLVDDDGRLLDANHPLIEDSLDWFFRVSRRHEVLWFEVSLHHRWPVAPVLRARRPGGEIEEWASSTALPLSQQLSQCVASWLGTRRVPPVAALEEFSLDDLRRTSDRLSTIERTLASGVELTDLGPGLTSPPTPLAIPFLRVLGELGGSDARSVDGAILRLDPTHPVARRNRYVSLLIHGDTDRRAILPIVEDAPMYAKPHLSVWGDSFPVRETGESVGLRHQGIAASLMPANPYACHNYSLQLADQDRREESFRWADRATVAAPAFAAAHLDCVRRLRQLGRPGQAFAEAQYRRREIVEPSTPAPPSTGKASEWQATYHADLLTAFVHLDVGRISEAIELADEAISRLPPDPTAREAFAWAQKRIAHWKTDAGLLARAYAWEAHHRGDPGRVIAGFARGRLTDDEDAGMWIEALLATGRYDEAYVAAGHCSGIDANGLLGDGKARLSAAKALLLAGDVDDALDHVQVVQLRRPQSRLDAEINRLWRLAAIRPAAEWERAISHRLERGAAMLAQLAARDIADFIPGADSKVLRRALGERRPLALRPSWIADLISAMPTAASSAGAIVARLAMPKDSSLEAADRLVHDWWSVLVPPARDRDEHAAGAVLALGVSLATYLVAASEAPSPIAGAYRHIATEALHLVRRSRYQLEPTAIEALLALLEHVADAPEWLFDTWLLRVERALDLEAEHGTYFDAMAARLPRVHKLLRGDERIGWELRLAHDLASDPSQYEAAATLFARCQRAVEGGTVELAWSRAATDGAPAAPQLDIHWLAAMANPTGVAAPWLRAARGLLASGRPTEGVMAACRGMAAAANDDERSRGLADLASLWRIAGITTPLGPDDASDAGLAAAAEGRGELAIQHLRWAAALEPGNATHGQNLAVTLARFGRAIEAVRALAPHERSEAPRLIGRLLRDAGRDVEALPILKLASSRFRTAEDWAFLGVVAHHAGDDLETVEAGRQAVLLGASSSELLVVLATSLYRLGEFAECERVALQLLDGREGHQVRVAGLHAMARALLGQRRHVEALPYAKAAADLGPNGELAAELIETMDRIVAQQPAPSAVAAVRAAVRRASTDLATGKFDDLLSLVRSASWPLARLGLAACEFRTEDESGIPVPPRALDASADVLARTVGTTDPDATLARIAALRIRDNAFIQIDPPPPLGTRFTRAEFERAYAERETRPHRPSAILSFSRQ